MARFTLPGGLRVTGEQVAASDADVRNYEDQQPSGSRVLVQVGFAFKWPCFGGTAVAIPTPTSVAG
ncbi:MAG: hypothetical protein Q8O40_09050 [Chloroflexota bacterium]|nr:hypothetical protein [Chloroflexota bacterium]